MGTKFVVRILALFVVFGLAFGAAQSAWAQGKSQLPQIKQPSSERFDIAGTIASSNSGVAQSTISGNGAISGNNVEATITVESGAMQGQTGISPTLSLSLAVVDGKAYIKISGLAAAGIEDKWYVFNAPQGANAGTIGSGKGIVPANPALAQAYTVTEVGKETLNGAPTTKYQIDVDVNKLIAAIAAQAGQGATPPTTLPPSLPKTQITEQDFVWIGDNDRYLYKLAETINVKVTGSSSSQIPNTTITEDITIQFHDFDQPVTITAPPNAEPLDLSGLGSSSSSMLQGAANSFLSNPLSAGLGNVMGMPSGVSAPAPVATPPVVVGMPTTGNSGSAVVLWPLAVLGLVCVAAGALIRRRVRDSR
jgi:hypothetical protein